MKEEWRPILGYEESYAVSSIGRVKSISRKRANGATLKEKLLQPGINKYGYCSVSLCKNGLIKQYKIHRLVAIAFLPNPKELPLINHKNEIKNDNRVENLEWCDWRYNTNYGNCINQLKSQHINPIVQMDLLGNFVTKYPSAKEAGRTLKIDYRNICKCANGRYKTCAGFVWKWLKDFNNDNTKVL